MVNPNVSGENRAPLNPLERPPVSPEVNAPTGGMNPAVFNPNNPLGEAMPAMPEMSGGMPMGMPMEEPILPPVEGSPIADFTPEEMMSLNEVGKVGGGDDPSRETAEQSMMQNMEAVWMEAILGADDE